MSELLNILPPTMKFKITQKFVIWMIIALFAPAALLSFSGQVICVGEDDHIQVELTGDVCCELGDSDLEAPKLPNSTREHSGCGDCSDVDINQVNSRRMLSRPTNLPATPLLTSLAGPLNSIPFVKCDGRQARRNEYAPALTQPQLQISTTILIC